MHTNNNIIILKLLMISFTKNCIKKRKLFIIKSSILKTKMIFCLKSIMRAIWWTSGGEVVANMQTSPTHLFGRNEQLLSWTNVQLLLTTLQTRFSSSFLSIFRTLASQKKTTQKCCGQGRCILWQVVQIKEVIWEYQKGWSSSSHPAEEKKTL